MFAVSLESPMRRIPPPHDVSLADRRTLAATKAGSCAILHDRDRDGDLDITGVDEKDDKILLWENPGR